MGWHSYIDREGMVNSFRRFHLVGTKLCTVHEALADDMPDAF